ncbi:MAG: thioredoxin TrxC [Rhodobacteraceae bacterium]|nr:thioredoxin TrxC [Paracoccaceae bacterium]
MRSEPLLVCMSCGQTNRLSAGGPAETAKCGTCGTPLLSGQVADLDSATHDKARGRDSLPLVVDYWAPWCGPCRMMAPEFARAAASLRGKARFARVNTEEHPDLAGRLDIRGIPLLILWQNGREVARLSGARPAADIVSFVTGSLRAAA